MISKEILDNGIPLYKIKISGVNTIGVAVGVRIGSIYEPKNKRGISHLLEHMMFKSNKKYTAKQINLGLELNGGLANAFTDTFLTAYLVETLPNGFKRVLDILFSMFENEKYREDEFNNEKKVVLSELERYNNDPETRLDDLIPKSVFGDSDYGDPVGGYRETVESISKEDLEEFKAKYYVSSNMFVVIEGNFSDSHIELIRKTFGSLQDEKVKKKVPTKERGKDIVDKMKTGNQIYFSQNYRVSIKDFIVAKAFSWLVSGGLSSLTFQTIREKYGIGYKVYFSPTYIYEDELIYTLGIPGFEKDKEKILPDAINGLFTEILEKDLSEYYNGRKRRAKLIYEKNKINIFGRLFKDTKYISLFEKTYDEIFTESYSIELEDLREFAKKLEDPKIAKIIPTS